MPHNSLTANAETTDLPHILGWVYDHEKEIKKLRAKDDIITTEIGNVETRINKKIAKVEGKVDDVSDKVDDLTLKVEKVISHYEGVEEAIIKTGKIKTKDNEESGNFNKIVTIIATFLTVTGLYFGAIQCEIIEFTYEGFISMMALTSVILIIGYYLLKRFVF